MELRKISMKIYKYLKIFFIDIQIIHIKNHAVEKSINWIDFLFPILKHHYFFFFNSFNSVLSKDTTKVGP